MSSRANNISNLQETLKRYQTQATDLTDFNFDLLSCTWPDVLDEMKRAEAAVLESNGQGKKFPTKAWRLLGRVGNIISPALEAIPDEICLVRGGIALIFSVSSHESLRLATNYGSLSLASSTPGSEPTEDPPRFQQSDKCYRHGTE